jgi:hypothetical protein
VERTGFPVDVKVRPVYGHAPPEPLQLMPTAIRVEANDAHTGATILPKQVMEFDTGF